MSSPLWTQRSLARLASWHRSKPPILQGRIFIDCHKRTQDCNGAAPLPSDAQSSSGSEVES
eukprot:413580-Amphidinium_carterae.1